MNIKLFLSRFLSLFKTYRAPLLSGFLFGCSFIPFPFFTLFFALIPLWMFIYRQNSLIKILIGCFLCQTLSTFISVNWIFYTLRSFGGMNWPLSLFVLLLYCCFANFYVTLSGGLWFFMAKRFPVFVKNKWPTRRLGFFNISSLFENLGPSREEKEGKLKEVERIKTFWIKLVYFFSKRNSSTGTQGANLSTSVTYEEHSSLAGARSAGRVGEKPGP